MTSVGPPSSPSPDHAHPDLDTLADYDAGLLDEAASRRVAAHADGCARCGSALAALHTVAADLHALPPPRLPTAVADRIDATLARLREESPPRVAAPAAAAGPPRFGSPRQHAGPAAGTVQPADLTAARDRRARRTSKLTGLAAAGVAVIAIGAAVTAAVQHNTGSNGSPAAQGGAVEPDGSTHGSTVGGPFPPGQFPTPSKGSSDNSGQESTGAPEYTPGSIEAALPGITERSAVSLIDQVGRAARFGVMVDKERRDRCARSVEPGGTLLAVERINFNGTSAYVFVFAKGSGRMAYVVRESCGAFVSTQSPVIYQTS